MIVCDRKTREKHWVVDIGSLEDLLAFQGKYGEIQIAYSAPFREVSREIRILGPQRN